MTKIMTEQEKYVDLQIKYVRLQLIVLFQNLLPIWDKIKVKAIEITEKKLYCESKKTCDYCPFHGMCSGMRDGIVMAYNDQEAIKGLIERLQKEDDLNKNKAEKFQK